MMIGAFRDPRTNKNGDSLVSICLKKHVSFKYESINMYSWGIRI